MKSTAPHSSSTPERIDGSKLDGAAIFRRIVVGIDDTGQAIAAARQAATLLPPGGTLHLLAAVEAGKAARAGFVAPGAARQLLLAARRTLDEAVAVTDPATHELVRGRPAECVLARVRSHEATLLALGAHGHRRAPGLMLGAVGSTLLRNAPCSVLLAHEGSWPVGHPERIVVGVDGSPQSTHAVHVARHLAAQFDARLTLLVGLGGKLRDARDVVSSHAEAIVDERHPVDALVAASEAADLLVVGSRGLHGLQALGSVSERVAHRAHASVLVVRSQADGVVATPAAGHAES